MHSAAYTRARRERRLSFSIEAARARVRAAGWLPALAVLAFGALAVNGFIAADALSRLANGAYRDDWTSLYAAATMVREGNGAHLYDAAAMASSQQALYGLDGRTNLFPLPPFAAIALAPLSALSFNASFGIWLGINVALLAGLLTLGLRAASAWPHAQAFAFAGFAATSAPVLAVLLLSQVDLLIVAAAAGCYALRRSGHERGAGAVLALGLLKPHLIAPIVLLLIVKREWRTLRAFAATGAVLLLAPIAVVGPRAFADQMALLAAFPGYTNELGINAARMINLRGLVLSVWSDAPVALWLAPMVAIAGGCTAGAVRLWSRRRLLDAHSWAVALLLPLVVSPHAHWNSAVLALAAAWFYIEARTAAGVPQRTAWMLAAYVALTVLWLLGLVLVSLAALALLPLLALMLRDRAVRAETPEVGRLETAADAA